MTDYNPIGVSSYLDLPVPIKRKRSLLNIQYVECSITSLILLYYITILHSFSLKFTTQTTAQYRGLVILYYSIFLTPLDNHTYV